jgi:hypothetical protein
VIKIRNIKLIKKPVNRNNIESTNITNRFNTITPKLRTKTTRKYFPNFRGKTADSKTNDNNILDIIS